MAPHADTPIDSDSDSDRLPAPPRPAISINPPRILIIGAGSRGNAYARATGESTNGVVVAIAEPIAYKRKRLGEKYIWGKNGSAEGQEFEDWNAFLVWEQGRRSRASKGEDVPEGVDAVFICVLDEMHKDVIVGLAPLGLHIMCEKPLATTLEDCIAIYKALLPKPDSTPTQIFSIGHVLRYSPHNMLLRKLLVEDKVIGDVLSINHTEPVGWWHFTHSYVRGNWRKESTTAPSLLTKSCHDIDLLLWLLCSPPPNTRLPPHIPKTISSSGALQYFNRTRKPTAAGSATNCLSCPIESTCQYSAKKIYVGPDYKGLETGNTKWPVDIVLPEIEDLMTTQGHESAKEVLLGKLKDDYTSSTPQSEISGRNWFGRCVYEADNDVCDDQVVTMTWDNDPLPPSSDSAPYNPEVALAGRGAKTAVFHMVSHTTKICERYTNIYGSTGEIYADSSTITVQSFSPPSLNPSVPTTKVYKPHIAGGGHGGGDDGLARQFILAVETVKNGGWKVEDAQREFVGAGVGEMVRSHGVVFAAEVARKEGVVLGFERWWDGVLGGIGV